MSSGFLKRIVESGKENASGIWLIVGMGCTALAIFFTAKGTVKSVKEIERIESELGRKLTKKEIVKVTWKNYIPAGMAAVGSGFAYSMGHKIHLKKEAVLATGYSVSQAALNEYQTKTKEIVGEEKEKEIRNAVAKDKIEKPQETSNVIFASGDKDLFIDNRSGREFYSTINKIDAAVNRINQRLLVEMFIPLNEYYYEIGLPEIDTEEGWDIDNGLVEVNYIPDISNGNHPAIRVIFPEYCKPKLENKH